MLKQRRLAFLLLIWLELSKAVWLYRLQSAYWSILHERFVIAVLEADASANGVGVLGLSRDSTLGASPQVVLDRSDVETISERLNSFDRKQLMSLLCDFFAIYDIDRCPFGVARSFCHSVDTGYVKPLRQGPCRVLSSEQGTLEKEVNNVLSK